MNNRHYNYENIGLWEPDAWKERYSPICALSKWIEAWNIKNVRHHGRTGKYVDRTDGEYDKKTLALTYPEVPRYWDRKGMEYRCSEMGDINWIALVPHAVRDGKEKNPDILVVLHEEDYGDPHWAMEAMEYLGEYNERAVEEGVLMLYIVGDGGDPDNVKIDILQELSVIYHLEMGKVYLDLTPLAREKKKLSEIPDFIWRDENGGILADPDGAIETVHGVPALNIAGRWQNKVSLLFNFCTAERNRHPSFDLERHIHSSCGKKMADGMILEHTYDSTDDPGLREILHSQGIEWENHEKEGEQWVSMAPRSAYEGKRGDLLPVMLVMQEVTKTNPFQSVAALSYFYEYRDLVAQGDLMLIFFALETPDDNDLLYDILQDAAEIFPIDKSRVYVTGHSHNGHFSMEFMRRHHRAIAAVASLGNSHGLPAPAYSHEAVRVTDDKVEHMSTFDMPVINIQGYQESEFVHNDVESAEFANGVDSFQRRLKAFNCPEKSFDQIAGAKGSGDYVTSRLGLPVDRGDVQYKMGCECCIGDIKNRDGKYRFRLVALENLPHMCAPQMPELSWEFVRRFARNLETGDLIELY